MYRYKLHASFLVSLEVFHLWWSCIMFNSNSQEFDQFYKAPLRWWIGIKLWNDHQAQESFLFDFCCDFVFLAFLPMAFILLEGIFWCFRFGHSYWSILMLLHSTVYGYFMAAMFYYPMCIFHINCYMYELLFENVTGNWTMSGTSMICEMQ